MGKDARWGTLAALFLSVLAGCQVLFPRHGLPEDPLFVDRKPLESKADTTRPAASRRSEPAPPANPYFTLSYPTVAQTIAGSTTITPGGKPDSDAK